MSVVWDKGGIKLDIRVKELIHNENIDDSLEGIINLWNYNCMETAECELEEEEKDGIKEQLQNYIQSQYGTVFIALDGKQHIIAYSIASIKHDLVSDTLYGQIDELYVAKEWRRKQIANELVTHTMQSFHEKDIFTVYVHVDLENQLAECFWEGMGFDKEFYMFSNL